MNSGHALGKDFYSTCTGPRFSVGSGANNLVKTNVFLLAIILVQIFKVSSVNS